MGALGIARLAGVACLAILPACAANTANSSERLRAEPLQLRPPEFKSNVREMALARLEQMRQSSNPAVAPGDAARVAERCGNIDNMPGGKVQGEAAPSAPILFLLIGRASGNVVPMPNGCDPKVDSARTRLGRN